MLIFCSLTILGGILGLFSTNYILRKIIIDVVGEYNMLLAKEDMSAIDRVIYRRLERWESYAESNTDLDSALIISNAEFDRMAQRDRYIEIEDKQWTEAANHEVTPFMAALINNKISSGLRDRADFYSEKYQYNIFPEFFITNKYGVNIAQTGKTTDYYQGDEDWWQQTVAQKLYMSDIDYDESSEVNSLTFGIRIDDGEGNFIGVIKVVYNIKDLYGLISEFENQKDDSFNAFLITDDGRLIYSTKSGFGNLVSDPEMMKVINVDLEGVDKYYIGPFHSIDRLVVHSHSDGYKDLKGLGWSVVISHDSDAVLAPLNKIVYMNFFVVVILVAVVIILILLISGWIIRPLKKLNQDILAIKDGDADHKVGTDAPDEIGDLARSFDEMVTAIKQSRADVDKKVEDQTREIQIKSDESIKKAGELVDQKKAILNILEDVEEEKDKAERAANDLEKFKLAVDSASDHIVITDAEGIVLYGNEAMEKITGYTLKESLGKKAGSLWRKPMEQKYYDNLWAKIKKERKAFVGEITNIRKSGEEYEATIYISPVLDKRGQVVYFVGIERDITKEKQIDRVKTEFVSLASHQLRTPLSSIGWYTEMLLAGDAGRINKEQKKFLEEIYHGNKRMVELVGSLLNVSRLELGTFAIEPETKDIAEVADVVVKELQPQIKAKKLRFDVVFDPSLRPLPLDVKLTDMIFLNLLSNAVKYTPEGGSVKLAVDNKQEGVLITVTDTGYGIPVDQHDHIFTKLFRADNVREHDADGTGLGLYMIKTILDNVGAKIWFDSVENKGTTFFVLIPPGGMQKKEGSKKME